MIRAVVFDVGECLDKGSMGKNRGTQQRVIGFTCRDPERVRVSPVPPAAPGQRLTSAGPRP
jgi:hypothetical protein